MQKIQAIKKFLKDNAQHGFDLLYDDTMEVQVMVAADGGEKVQGEYKGVTWHGYSDTITTWKNIRIPWGDGNYIDSEMTWDLAAHAKEIGLSGWDWTYKVSRWVVFDFDAIVGHSSRHTKKMSEQELVDLTKKASGIPWVEVRRSTSGRGLHMYVYVDMISTATREHHAALARAILSEMSLYCGYPFDLSVDVCGMIAWVWARRQTPVGFEVIKRAEGLCPEPQGWMNHLQVTTGEKRHVYDDNIRDIVLHKDLTALDEDHLKLITWLKNNNCFCQWNSEVSMLVTHTAHLKDAHAALNLIGLFDTDTKHSTEKNCFAYAVPNGGWMIYRYGKGVNEHPYWTQDGTNWTRILYNQMPGFEQLCKQFGGIEDEKNFFHIDGVKFENLMTSLGQPFYERFRYRTVAIKELNNGRAQAIVEKFPDDAPIGWLSKGKKWQKIITIPKGETYQINSEVIVRHLIAGSGDAGWCIKTQGWIDEPVQNVKLALASEGLSAKEITSVLGQSIMKPWSLVVRPFEEEYLGNRLWNRSGSQFRFTATPGTYPTWQSILDHVGKGLTANLPRDDWFGDNGIYTGADYLFCWLSALLQYPFEPLPFLFIHSQQQMTGKSMLHEAASLLFHPGVVRAETALKSTNDFNGELEGAILCIVEEVNLQKDMAAYNRIKDYVTSRSISIHTKQKTPRMLPNTTHWIQTANDITYCPIFPGDSRITFIHVPQRPEVMVPKKIIIENLEREGPAFLNALLEYQVPEQRDRLMVPVVETDEKLSAASKNRTDLEIFMGEYLVDCPGSSIKFFDFWTRFDKWLDPSERPLWSKNKVTKQLTLVQGRLTNDSYKHIGNVRWVDQTWEDSGQEYVLHEGRLVLKDREHGIK